MTCLFNNFKLVISSFPGKCCISAVLKKVSHNHFCLLEQTVAYIENATIGCYDRLVNNLVLMVLCQLSLPKTVTSCLTTLWDKAIHLIRTIHDISNVTYGSTEDLPLLRPGQGSMCGPFFWLLRHWLNAVVS